MAHYLQSHAADQQPLASKTAPANWSERLRLAWYFVHLIDLLDKGIVQFSFWKSDGTIREAYGTRNLHFIPSTAEPQGTSTRSPQWGTITFFDLKKAEWRSFRITHFIGYVTCYELKESDKKKEPKKN